MTILIVEDDALNRKLAQHLLQRAGFKTLEASSADAGIMLARSQGPDLILMDVHLPLKSGYEACQELQASPETRDIPLVAFTALGLPEEREQTLAVGFVDVITKPIDVKLFSQQVAAALVLGHCASMKAQPQISESSDAAFQAKAGAGLSVASARTNGECPDCKTLASIRQDYQSFLRYASHDLQAPLRKIRQFVRFLDLPDVVKPDGEAHQYLAGIERNLNEMETLLSGLLKLSRVNAEAVVLTPVSLQEVMDDVVFALQPQLLAVGASVRVDALMPVRGEPERLREVFHELLQNSLRFRSPDRPLQIRIAGACLEAGLYEVCVEDNGVGLPTGDISRIFEPFERQSGPLGAGSGLGLAMVKSVLGRYGGEVCASGEPGVSTSVRLRFPVES